MPKKVAIIISPNWRDYAKKYLADCLESIKKQDWAGESKIFLVDNETSEKGFNLLKKIAPDAEIIRNKNNDGFAKGCNDAIRKALEDDFEYFAIFNIHTILEPDCLRKLVEKMEGADNIGLVQGRMMLYGGNPSAGSGCNKISSIGNKTHFLGFGYCDGYQEKWSDQAKDGQDIFYPSGSCILTKREVLEKIGLLDEEYWMYNEDQELGWRTWLAGWRCVLATDAVLYNKYEFQRSIKKYYWMDRNRILAILECYHVLTLILIFPAFLAMEIGLILFSLKQSWLRDKIKVWKYFLTLKNWRYILKARKRNQQLRKIKDKDIADMITGKIWYQEIGDWKLKLVNPVFQAYWWAVKRVMFW